MNVVTVRINGIEYSLKGEENEEYLHKVAGYVDKKMREIIKKKKELSIASSAVLTAVNSADEMFKALKANEEFKNKAASSDKNQKVLNDEIQLLKKQLKHMQQYNEELQNKIKNSNIKKYEEEIFKLNQELDSMQESTKEHIKEELKLREENKEIKFQLQTSKYKIIELNNNLIENQIDLAKVKQLSDLKNLPLRNKKNKKNSL